MMLHDYEMSATERKKPMKGTPEEIAANVAGRATAVSRLRSVLQKALDADGTQKLMTDIELPMVRVLTEMEWTGVRIDTEELAKMSRTLTDRVTALEQQCYDMAGVTFNIGSPMQVGEVLFSRLNIDPKAKKTKNGAWSTTEEILEKYRHDWPIVDLILEIRGLRKLLATYVDALPRLINPVTGRIHTTYNQTVTATGRLSSANPNLQNIPIRTDEGREIRRAFIASPGNVILSADYSQIELRLMADISGDPVMVQAFLSGEDIHRATAAKIYHLPIEEVSDSQRRNAKTANFGIIYGISAFGLSERLGIPRSEAKALIEGYLKTYPRVAEYMNEAIQSARDNEYVSTVMGRKRYLPEINSRNAVVRGYAERNAINAPLQGSAADIIKIAMINIAREMKARGMKSRMITQVHDELVFDVVPAELEELTKLVTEKMQGAYKARVPLTVSAGTGDNWLEAH
jgi:DNA polymerase-1